MAPGLQSIVGDSYAVPARCPVSSDAGSRKITLAIRNGGLGAKCVLSGEGRLPMDRLYGDGRGLFWLSVVVNHEGKLRVGTRG